MCATYGCSGNYTLFSQASKDAIIKYRNTRGCLTGGNGNQSPTLTTIAPDTVSAFNGGNVTLTGTDLDSVLSIDVGSTTLWPHGGGIKVYSASKVEFVSPTYDTPLAGLYLCGRSI